MVRFLYVESCSYFFFGFLRQGFFFSFGAYPGTRSGDQAGLELTVIHLPLPPECWD